MAIEKVMVIGLCLAILKALVLYTQQGKLKYHVSVLTYPSQTLDLPPHISSHVVEHKRSDFSSISLQDAFAGQDLVINTMAGGDSELQISIIEALLAAGVPRFIPHEFGHDILNRGIEERIPKYAGRAKVLEYLQSNISEANPHFNWIGIATGYMLNTNLISGNLGFDMVWHSATIYGIGTEPFAACGLERVGQVIVKTIEHWDRIKCHYIYAAGVITSANEVLRCAEKATGREWTVGNYDVDDSVREGKARIRHGST